MDREVLKTISGLCNNIEELIRNNPAKSPIYTQQKVVLDLYMTVTAFQCYFKKAIGD